MPDYATAWFARAIRTHDAVVSALALPNGHVRVERGGLWPVTIAPLGCDRVDLGIVQEVLADADPTIILPIRRDAHYDWSARDYAQRRGSTVHTYREMVTSLGFPDPRPHVEQMVEFATDRLGQHSRVLRVEMICEAYFSVVRRDLPALTVAVAYEYEMTEEALVRAIQRHPGAQIIYNANPNGRPTEAALGHGQFASVETYRFGDLMRRVGRV